MTDILKVLGDDWHTSNPYLKLIESVLPSSKYGVQIQDALLRVYEDQHFEFRRLKENRKVETIYDGELEVNEFRIKQLQEEMKKEDQHYQGLLEKFQKTEIHEKTLDEEEEAEEDEEEEEDDTQANQKKKGVQKACKRSLKAEELKKIQQAKGLKSSMATSQQKMIDLRDEVEGLEKKCEYYKHYQYASRCYISGYRKALREYSETKDVTSLIKSLSDIVSYYDKMMRRYVPEEPCCGEDRNLCTTHLLPLSRAYNARSGLWDILKCQVSPC